jgi:hypothetical protein
MVKAIKKDLEMHLGVALVKPKTAKARYAYMRQRNSANKSGTTPKASFK